MISSAETPTVGFPRLELGHPVEARHLADSVVEDSLGGSRQEGLRLMRKYRLKSFLIVSSEEALPRWAVVVLVLLVRMITYKPTFLIRPLIENPQEALNLFSIWVAAPDFEFTSSAGNALVEDHAKPTAKLNPQRPAGPHLPSYYLSSFYLCFPSYHPFSPEARQRLQDLPIVSTGRSRLTPCTA
jgi:hypothetical protein